MRYSESICTALNSLNMWYKRVNKLSRCLWKMNTWLLTLGRSWRFKVYLILSSWPSQFGYSVVNIFLSSTPPTRKMLQSGEGVTKDLSLSFVSNNSTDSGFISPTCRIFDQSLWLSLTLSNSEWLSLWLWPTNEFYQARQICSYSWLVQIFRCDRLLLFRSLYSPIAQCVYIFTEVAVRTWTTCGGKRLK